MPHRLLARASVLALCLIETPTDAFVLGAGEIGAAAGDAERGEALVASPGPARRSSALRHALRSPGQSGLAMDLAASLPIVPVPAAALQPSDVVDEEDVDLDSHPQHKVAAASRLEQAAAASELLSNAVRERDMTLVAAGFMLGVCTTLVFMFSAPRIWRHLASSSADSEPKASGTATLATKLPAKEESDDPHRMASTASMELIEQEYSESLDSFWPRTFVLAVMLLVQSLSSFVLYFFRALVMEHPELVYFLTMLVGLGGNAGGQSVVLAVRDIAFGREVKLGRQVIFGLGMGIVLAPLAYARAYYTDSSATKLASVIGISVVFISTTATILGTLLPKFCNQMEIDPGHTSPVVQVLMDMIGITIVCTTGWLILDVAEGHPSLAVAPDATAT